MKDSKKENVKAECIQAHSLPAKLYITEAKKSLEKALAEKDVLDPEDPKALEKLISEAKK